MGDETCKFANFPTAVVAFGKDLSDRNFEKLQEQLSITATLANAATSALQHGSDHIATIVVIAPGVGTAFAIIAKAANFYINEAAKLNIKLKELEEKIFDTILEGKLTALKFNLENIENRKTSETQKVSEIVNALSNLTEVVVIFEKEISLYREKFYLGAPLFVCFCGVFKSVCTIADQTPEYNTCNLGPLKRRYQNILEWYRDKCIGSRLASCYVKPMLMPTGGTWTHDWRRLYETNKIYYKDGDSSPWTKYGKDLGGEGWRLWYNYVMFHNLIDPWDVRLESEVQFEKFQLKIQSKDGARKDILAEYRKRVKEVMLKFFDDASPILLK